ncbi:MAG: hopanoid biosynthesis associated radical SAM protein HpnJ [Acidobacteriota bacterium]|nr:hopanoid biosynthesis associated radical SAM protein HpnJ [Acidobacteriota bacterium]
MTTPLKTLFLNPPSFEKFDGGASSRWPATREIESYWYPVWLTYPAGMLEGSRLLDAPPHHIKWAEVVTILKDYEFLVLFTSTMGWDGDQRMAETIKQTYPSIKIAFVGPPVTTSPDKALNECPAIDFICRREFDFSVVEFAQGKPLHEILGVSYKDENGVIQHNPDRAQVTPEQLDEMPWATEIYARDLDVTKYSVPFLLHPYVSLYSTRGCPAQCTFCLWPQTLSGHAWRKRSTDDVAAEMANAKKLFPHVKEFFFDDDTFNIQKARTIELCEKLKPLGLTWSCTSRVTTDFDTLKAMKEAGCRLLIVGYESGDPQILKNIKKGATVQRALDFQRDCHKLGLVVHGDFILGLPGETRESIRNTIDFAKQLDCETIQVSIAHAFPGTEFFDYAKDNGFITNEAMSDEGGHQMAHIEYPGLPVEYVMEMVHKFYDEYYFRPKAAMRVIWQAVVNRDVPRLYTEAKSFMKLRAQRNKAARAATALKAQEHVGQGA